MTATSRGAAPALWQGAAFGARAVPGPLSAGTAAFPWPRPHRGEVDEWVWDGLVFSCEPGYRPLVLDLHVPRGAEPGERLPLLVWVHGGGWTAGSRRRLSPDLDRHWIIERMLLAGFAVALTDYRLADEAAFPAPVADLRAAVRWLRGHADDFGLDSARVAYWGESAGAHLACLAATCDRELGDRGDLREDVDQPEDVQAVVDWFGPADMAALRTAAPAGSSEEVRPGTTDPVGRVLDGSGWDDSAASPVTYVRSGLPPFLIAHGRDDDTVPVAQARDYRDALTAAGVDTEYVETDGGHVFVGASVLNDVIERSLNFLRSRLDVPVRPRLDPQVADVENRIRQKGFPLLDTDDPIAARRRAMELRREFYPAQPYLVDSVADTAIAGPGGQLELRIQRPAVPAGVVILYAHGGGWVSGGVESHRGTAARLTASTSATTVQVKYRLAPEHPFPAGFDDTVAAVQWAAGHLDELGGTRLVLAGDGAGGNLVAAAATSCRDDGIDVAAVLLVHPVTDWTRRPVGGLVATYLAGSEEAATDPRVSPVLADLAGLPPVILGVGALDPLLEDNLEFVHRLREAAVPVALHVFPTLDHGFLGYASVSSAADRASEQICRDLSRLMWETRGGRPGPPPVDT